MLAPMDQLTAELRRREDVRDHYWSRDGIIALRLHWRACSFRHLVHLLPGETILEIGAGKGAYTKALEAMTRGENPITSIVLQKTENIEEVLNGKTFDYVVAHQLLDAEHCPAFMKLVHRALKPGGKFVLFESNPWNPVRKLRCALSNVLSWIRRGDESALLNPVEFYRLLSELGFIRIGTTCYDFLYKPIPRFLLPLLRNASLILENTPGIRRLAGSLLVSAQVPPKDMPRPAVPLTNHPEFKSAVSVVIPCYNEEMNVRPLVERLKAHYDDYICQFVLVNDNSKDSTREVIRELGQTEPRITLVDRTPPGGVGYAIRDGIVAAKGTYVLTADCDFTHILPELRDLFDAVSAGADVAYGSRFSRESVLINYPLSKILCNRSFHILLSLLFRRRIRDVTNNLKLMRRSVVDRLVLTQQHFSVNAETGLEPVLMGFKCVQVPISWINRTPEMGTSSFKLLKVGMGYVKVLARLAWQSRLGTKTI